MTYQKYIKGELLYIVGNKMNHKFELGTKVRILSFTGASYAAEYLNKRDYWYVSPSDISKTQIKSKTMKKTLATKKQAVVKKSSVAIKPLNSYDDYEVYTDSGNAEFVSFGCGEVKISRKDMMAVADIFDNPDEKKTLKKLLAEADKFNYFTKDYLVEEDFLKELNVAQQILKNKSLMSFLRILKQTNDRKTQGELLKVSSGTYRRLAAVPKNKTC